MSAKYPRTFHLPWSPGGTNDDKRIPDVEHLVDRALVITEKLDGSNVCLTSEAVFARSHAGPPKHPSFSPLKALHAAVRDRMPTYLSFFGEWCYAVHSIRYDHLPHHLNLFGVRDDEAKVWLSWDEVKFWAKVLEVKFVPHVESVDLDGVQELESLTNRLGRYESRYGSTREGLVVRPHGPVSDEAFSRFVLKWVREDHVQTDEHWLKGSFDVQPLGKRE